MSYRIILVEDPLDRHTPVDGRLQTLFECDTREEVDFIIEIMLDAVLVLGRVEAPCAQAEKLCAANALPPMTGPHESFGVLGGQ